MASKSLRELSKEIPGLKIEEVDVLRRPSESWKNGVRLIPALKIEDDILSGIYLTREAIAAFVRQHITNN